MAYGKRTFNYRKLIIPAVIVLIAIIVIFASYLITKKRSAEAPTSSNSVMVSNTKKEVNVVRATKEMKAGAVTGIADFEIVAVPEHLVPTGAISDIKQLDKKRLRNALAAKEFLLSTDLIDATAWYEPGDRLIEHIFSETTVPLPVAVGSLVDVRLFRKDNSDCVVISKVAVVDRVGNTLTFYLNNMEQEYLKESAAEGTPLFVVQYLDAEQPASEITYNPPFRLNNDKSGTSKSTDDFTKSPGL